MITDNWQVLTWREHGCSYSADLLLILSICSGKSTVMRMSATGVVSIPCACENEIVLTVYCRSWHSWACMYLPPVPSKSYSLFSNKSSHSYARLCPLDAILTRMGAYDNMFSNASTFKVELDEWWVDFVEIGIINLTSSQLQSFARRDY